MSTRVADGPGSVHVVVPGDVDDEAVPSGGNVYDRRICQGLPASGWPVTEIPVPGTWPRPGAAARRALARALDGVPDGGVVVVDGLVACGVPEVVVEAVDAVTRRPGEPYIAGLIRRAAAHPLGRLVKLADNAHNLASNAELARVDPGKARSLREGRYRPARRILLAAEAADTRSGRRVLV